MSLRPSRRAWTIVACLAFAVTLVIARPAAACLGDFDETGDVGFGDMTELLLHWSPARIGLGPWDLNGDGTVGFADLTQLLLSWGECPCGPSSLAWLPTFGSSPGPGATVHALALFDDGSGSGPALYAGGSFLNVGGSAADRVARWNGSSWSAVGNGLYSTVYALEAYDDGSGSGPSLYAGVLGGLWRWDGSVWANAAVGTDGFVYALAVHDDGSGSGPALYAAGGFTSVGGVAANGIARWDGSSWSPLGSGTNGPAHAIAFHDDGTGAGESLYVGGAFSSAGGVPGTSAVARWDGSTWSATGSGLNDTVWGLAVFDDGSGAGPQLWAAGEFAGFAARWDGSTWSAAGSGLSDIGYDLATHDDGSGAGLALYVAGQFTGGIRRWNGANWLTVAGGTDDVVMTLDALDAGDGAGPDLYAGGAFTSAGTAMVGALARLDESSWSPFGSGLNGEVSALAVWDELDDSHPEMYVGGLFVDAGGTAGADRIARWDGAAWSALGSGIGNGEVRALAVYDDGSGSGEALYVGGTFINAGSIAEADRIARWDGSSWSALSTGIDSHVNALAVYDDGSGSGPALYAGGSFTTAGGVPASRIARWDGSSWSALSTGIDNSVFALAVYDDGSGSGLALYAGGFFTTAGGVPASRIARWDGSSWSGVGGVTNGNILAMTVHDDGSGSGAALYVGGSFTNAGSVGAADRIARWDGSTWSALGTGASNVVYALAVYDDGSGSGPALYAGGIFLVAGGALANRIARWNGAAWSPLGGGTSSSVLAFAVYDDGSGSGAALHAGGSFTGAIDSGDSYLAKWGCR